MDIRYTIAYVSDSGLLMACIPDGGDIEQAIREEAGRAGIEPPAMSSLTIASGCTLTDDDEAGRVVYDSGAGRLGMLTDTSGTAYGYAVRP